jgi:TrpR-related protein YerC/YecD
MYESKIKDKLVDQLFEAILKLRNIEECYRFFEDIATINEIKALAQRLEVARMLRQKKTYIEIAEKTGASTATISRVNRALNYGANGYKIILERLEADSKSRD